MRRSPGRVPTASQRICTPCRLIAARVSVRLSSTTTSPLDYAEDCLIAEWHGRRFGDNYDWTYNGHLTVTNSIVIHNYRDVWGLTGLTGRPNQ
jgi:hypothetical protein